MIRVSPELTEPYLRRHALIEGATQRLHTGWLLQHGVEGPQHPELAQDHRPRRVTVKQLNPPVLETKDVAAGPVHAVARWRKDPLTQPEPPVVSPWSASSTTTTSPATYTS